MSLLVRFSDGECRAWFAAALAICAFPDPRPRPRVLIAGAAMPTDDTDPNGPWGPRGLGHLVYAAF